MGGFFWLQSYFGAFLYVAKPSACVANGGISFVMVRFACCLISKREDRAQGRDGPINGQLRKRKLRGAELSKKRVPGRWGGDFLENRLWGV